MISVFQFQIVAGSETIEHVVYVIGVSDFTLINGVTNGENTHSGLLEDQEVVRAQKESFDWHFPQMIILVSVNDEVCHRIDHIYVVGVDVDALETNYQDVIGGSWTIYHE